MCFEYFVSVGDVCSEGLRGCECVDAFYGKVSFGEDGDEFSSDIACGADNGDVVGHKEILGGFFGGEKEKGGGCVGRVAYYGREGKTRG